jgi:hypothetical protein
VQPYRIFSGSPDAGIGQIGGATFAIQLEGKNLRRIGGRLDEGWIILIQCFCSLATGSCILCTANNPLPPWKSLAGSLFEIVVIFTSGTDS